MLFSVTHKSSFVLAIGLFAAAGASDAFGGDTDAEPIVIGAEALQNAHTVGDRVAAAVKLIINQTLTKTKENHFDDDTVNDPVVVSAAVVAGRWHHVIAACGAPCTAIELQVSDGKAEVLAVNFPSGPVVVLRLRARQDGDYKIKLRAIDCPPPAQSCPVAYVVYRAEDGTVIAPTATVVAPPPRVVAAPPPPRAVAEPPSTKPRNSPTPRRFLSSEPPEGHLLPGQRVLVDDGSCPKGKIKEITGGSNRIYRTSVARPGAPRQRRCIDLATNF